MARARHAHSWDRFWRVIGKAAWTRGEANSRFIVTSLEPAEGAGQYRDDAIYCARGQMENGSRNATPTSCADRTSAAIVRAGQLRLWFASIAFVLLCALRRIGLAHTRFARKTSISPAQPARIPSTASIAAPTVSQKPS